MKNSTIIFSIIIILSLSGFAQPVNSDKASGINKITIQVNDIKAQSGWYESVFNFLKKPGKDENKTILKKDDFILELVRQKKVVARRNLQLPDQMMFLSGFNKFGFVINHLDKLFGRIKQRNIETAGDIFLDKNLEFRTFIVKDPEGNMVQFFEPLGLFKEYQVKDNEWKPAFLMIMTDSHQRTIDWYKDKLQFEEIGNLDNPARAIFHRTLFNGSILLELAEVTGKIATREKYPKIWKNAGGIISVGVSDNGKKEKLMFDDSSNLIRTTRK